LSLFFDTLCKITNELYSNHLLRIYKYILVYIRYIYTCIYTCIYTSIYLYIYAKDTRVVYTRVINYDLALYLKVHFSETRIILHFFTMALSGY